MGMGSIGIFSLSSIDELKYFEEHFKAVSINGSNDLEFIVEEYIDGQEVCIDGIISNGHITVYGIGDKWTTEKHHLEYYEIFPSHLPQSLQEETVKSVKSILEDFGFDNCTFHMEGKVNEQRGFKLIEVGARPGGDHWISHILRIVTGINGYQEAVKVCAGYSSKPDVNYNGFAAIRYLLAKKEGTLTGYNHWDVAANIPEVEHIFPEVQLGTEIRLPPECYRTQKLVNIIARSNDYDQLRSAVERAVNTIEAVIG
jgi:biotin carboxylase